MRYKIIISGPVGAGKTTAINALTDDKALKTDVPVTDVATSQRKETTTVALDYGVIRLSDEDVIHVYGTPGQERFDFMWDILSQGAHGLVLLMDNCRNYPFRDLKYYTEQFSSLIKDTRMILGVTRFDEKDEPGLDSYRQWLRELGIDAKVMAIDARKKEDIHRIVTELVTETQTTAADSEVRNEDPPLYGISKAEKPAGEKQPITNPGKMKLTRASMQAAVKVNGVIGASLANDIGELIDSTIEDEELNELIAFVSGVTQVLEEGLNMGEIHRIMFRSPRDENLTVFVEDGYSLGVTSERKASVPAISQQIEDLLQWM